MSISSLTGAAPTPSSAGQSIINALNLGSGLDVTGLVSSLVAAQQDPQQALIDAQEGGVTSKLTAVGTLTSSLDALQTAAQGLEASSLYTTPTVTSTNPGAVSATATSTASLGNHTVNVVNLAQAQEVVSGEFSSPNTVVGTGSLTFVLGTITDRNGNPTTPTNGVYGAGTTFSVNPNVPSGTVTITSQNDTLSGIAQAINAAQVGVTASVVNDGQGYRLALASNLTGVNNAVQVNVNDGDGNNTDGNGLSQLSYNVAAPAGAGQNLTEVRTATNANFTVDGVAITSSTNAPSTVLPGVTLNLTAPTNGTVNLSVTANAAPAITAVQSFVTAYNALNSTLANVSAYNASDPTKNGALLGDPLIQEVENPLQTVLNNVLPGGSLTSLSQVGLSTDANGNLTLNTDQFTNALTTNPSAVAALFGTYGTTSSSSLSYNGATAATQPGSYAVNIVQNATQASVTAPGTVSSTDLSSTTNTFSVNVNGTSSGLIALPSQSYASANDVANALQSAINGDSALKAAGQSVSVGYDATNNQFTFTSNAYGSVSSIALTGVSNDLQTALGLGTTSTATGTDVVGTIGPWAATGQGQTLTGTGSALGLSLTTSGGPTGYVGTAVYHQGFATQIDNLIGNLLGSNGAVTADQTSLNATMTNLQGQTTTLNQRTAALQANYLAEYNAMETTLSSLHATSTYLSQQIASWTKTSGG